MPDVFVSFVMTPSPAGRPHLFFADLDSAVNGRGGRGAFGSLFIIEIVR